MADVREKDEPLPIFFAISADYYQKIYGNNERHPITRQKNPSKETPQMKSQNLVHLLRCGIIVAATISSLKAASTWTGSGTNNNWSTAGNWSGGLPAVTNSVMVFDGTYSLNSNNDRVTSLYSLGNTITFAPGAGSFVLGGNALSLPASGTIVNQSANEQTIANALSFGGGLTSSVYFNTGSGGIVLSGSLSGQPQLVKTGAGTLTLSGNDSGYTGILKVYQGRLLLDVAGGGISASSGLYFGTGGAGSAPNTQTNANVGGVFEIRGNESGATSVSLNSFLLWYSSGANQIVLDANHGTGTTLSIPSLLRYAGVNTGQSTLNIDLSSSSGNHFLITSAATPATNGILPYATVTTTGGTTALAGVTGSASNWEVAPLVTSGSLPAATGNANTNYSTQGNLPLTATTNANSLTITGSGSLSGAYTVNPVAVLMQEGSGDYTVSAATKLGRDNTAFFLHQYSTDGDLIINGQLFGAVYATNSRLSKTGPGRVILNGTAPTLLAATDIQQGEFQLNGSLASTTAIFVRNGATLSGSGSAGGGRDAAGTGHNYTQTYIFAGGTLVGTRETDDALQINGSLTFYEGSNYQVDLYDSAFSALTVTSDPAVFTPVVTLDGNLKLTLNYAPAVLDEITLLSSNHGFTGTFASVNGEAFGPGSTFGLGAYQFEITYGPTSVYLTALSVVPEPSTALLLAFGGLALWTVRRRRLA